ncbi:unnamed protein product [Heligmosomoides polygyrus]|uniref:Uncharacterized protein n=1 Tax=Heligmosomoides polygyrus TaxID=6339 RepID=A0A183GIG1_HELPZ|nr:unnamed protein product [Heligmosomoides polygyrus]
MQLKVAWNSICRVFWMVSLPQKNPQDAYDRAQILKAAISVERLKDQLKSAESAISSLRKKLYAKTRAESAETSSDFGSLDPPEGDFKIAPSSIGPGGDLKELYIRLRRRSRPMSHTSDYMNFFSKFVGNVVTEMYDRSIWHRLTARTKKRRNDYTDFDSDAIINFVTATYAHANKQVGESFYMDVFNMIAVALTNFRRNLKTQARSDHCTDQQAEKENTNEVQMQDLLPFHKDNDVVSQEASQASAALTFFDYYQE